MGQALCHILFIDYLISQQLSEIDAVVIPLLLPEAKPKALGVKLPKITQLSSKW